MSQRHARNRARGRIQRLEGGGRDRRVDLDAAEHRLCPHLQPLAHEAIGLLRLSGSRRREIAFAHGSRKIGIGRHAVNAVIPSEIEGIRFPYRESSRVTMKPHSSIPTGSRRRLSSSLPNNLVERSDLLHARRGAPSAHAICVSLLRKRASATPKNTPPITTMARSSRQTTSSPAPRYRIA